jgi:myo-inositol-1(or 4)-monophosphatase
VAPVSAGPADLSTVSGRLAIAQQAVAFAREAGELLLQFGERLETLGRRTKTARRDLVTDADLAAERCLVARLRAAFPDHAIEAEEEVRDVQDQRPRWFVDPLDGTVNFVHGLPAFAVSLGLVHRGQPLVGVVHAPRLGETYWGAQGAGAFLAGDAPGGRDSADRRLRISETTELADAIVATGFPYRRNQLANDNVGNFARLVLEVRDLRRFGSAALDLALCAAGRIDAYWELHLEPHDVAAGALLVREAGGRVTDTEGGEQWLRGRRVVAGPEALHGQLLARLDGTGVDRDRAPG